MAESDLSKTLEKEWRVSDPGRREREPTETPPVSLAGLFSSTRSPLEASYHLPDPFTEEPSKENESTMPTRIRSMQSHSSLPDLQAQ